MFSVRRVFVAIAILLSAAILAVWTMNGTRTPEADSAERSDRDEVVVPLTDAEAVEIAERNLLGLSRQPEIPATVERTGDHVRVWLPLFLFPHRSNRSFPDDWVSVWIHAKTGEVIRSPVAISQAAAVEIAKRETADLFYDRNAAPAVEFGSSVCKVTFWFPPDPGLPGKTFAAATVWIDAEKKSVIQVEVVED